MVRMIVRHDNRAKAGPRFDDGARERRQVFRMPDACVNEHGAARTHDEIGVVPRPGHRSGISRVEDDWRKGTGHTLETIAEPQKRMRIAMLVRSSTRTLTCAPAIHNRRLHT